jgi:hypothetical protein
MTAFRATLTVCGGLLALVVVLTAGQPARADHAPAFVLGPGRVSVPAPPPGSVVVGDTGLNRPGHMQPYYVELPYPTHVPGHAMRYFPADGRVRPVGRYEVPDGVSRPMPARKTARTWSTPPVAPPVAPVDGIWSAPVLGPVIVAPTVRPRRER